MPTNPTELVARARGAAVATDAANRLVAWNDAAEELLGLAQQGWALGQSFYEAIEARDSFGNRLPGGDLPFLEMTQRGEPIQGFELLASGIDGERLHISVSPVVIIGPEDSDLAVVHFLRPIIRRRRADEAIERILAHPGEVMGALGRKGEQAGIQLTERQTEILTQLADGLSNDEIAKILNISVHTVRSHVQGLLDKLGVRSRVEAVAKAFRERLL